jgi:TonB family protein
MLLRKFLVGGLMMGTSMAWAAALPQRATSIPLPAAQRVPQFVTTIVHHAAFGNPLQAQPGRCERLESAEPLATPDPLLGREVSKARIAVSFIIGADGRVYSPVILEGAGDEEDRSVLDAVLSWRYRPATCNAAPTAIESKVEFSSR